MANLRGSVSFVVAIENSKNATSQTNFVTLTRLLPFWARWKVEGRIPNRN